MATVLNIGSGSADLRAQALSNFPRFPFVLDGVHLASAEGFIQGIKYPEGSPERNMAFGFAGNAAKRFGRRAQRQWVWWQGRAISYGSSEHHALIERAIRAKFEQNEPAMAALRATAGMTLVHDLGHPESSHTSLPAKVFCDILTRIRDE